MLLLTEVWEGGSQSMSTYQRVTRRSSDWFWLYEWELVCVSIHVYVSVYVCVPVAEAGVEQRRLLLHIFKRRLGSMQQGAADGGSAGGCRGGWEESHCFKKTRHNCRAEHLIQARASTLQPPQQGGEGVWGVEGDFCIRRCLTLSPVQTREKNWRSYHYSPSCSLNTLLHLPPSLLLGVEKQKMCQKLQNKLKKIHFLKKWFTQHE